jgi:hypothetical protein
LLSSLDLPELAHGDSVVVAVHGFLSPDETIKFENPARSERQFHLNTLPQNGLEISHAQDLTQAIQNTQVRSQVQVLQSGALFWGQIDRQVWSQTMHWVQVGNSLLDALEVGFIKPAANVYIAGYQRSPVGDSSEPTDQDELDLAFNEAACQLT